MLILLPSELDFFGPDTNQDKQFSLISGNSKCFTLSTTKQPSGSTIRGAELWLRQLCLLLYAEAASDKDDSVETYMLQYSTNGSQAGVI